MIIWASGRENLLLKQWIEERIDHLSLPDSCQCAAVLRDNKLCAAICYYDYRETDIMLAFASDNPRWATDDTVNALLAYPFAQLRCYRVSALIDKGNRRSRRLAMGVGFVEEGKLRKAGHDGTDLILYGLTDEDYLEKLDARKARRGSADPAPRTANDTVHQ